jgi:hypothetical protein
MSFSSDHMDRGYHTSEIMRLQHCELLIDAVEKKLPMLWMR